MTSPMSEKMARTHACDNSMEMLSNNKVLNEIKCRVLERHGTEFLLRNAECLYPNKIRASGRYSQRGV